MRPFPSANAVMAVDGAGVKVVCVKPGAGE